MSKEELSKAILESNLTEEHCYIILGMISGLTNGRKSSVILDFETQPNEYINKKY